MASVTFPYCWQSEIDKRAVEKPVPLTWNFKELVESQTVADPAFAEVLRREGANQMTPARMALLAFAKVWTYPILGNEDVPVVEDLFEQARALAKNAAASTADPSEFAAWLEILRDKPGGHLLEWEETLHAATDYFGLSREKRESDRQHRQSTKMETEDVKDTKRPPVRTLAGDHQYTS